MVDGGPSDLHGLIGDLHDLVGQLRATLPPDLDDAVAAWARLRGVELTPRPELGALRFVVDGARARYVAYLVARDQPEQLLCYVVSPIEVDPDVRKVFAELLARINWTLDVAHLELDWGTRELRCRTSLDVADAPVPPGVIDRLIANASAVVDRYHDALAAVADGGQLPEDALAELDG